jgi:chloride channel protein, CIC family
MSIAALNRPKTGEHSTKHGASGVFISGIWALALGLVSGVACVGVRLFFRLLQWIFVQHTGLLSEAAETLSPGRKILTPILGALCATAVLWAVRRCSLSGQFEEYVEAVRFHAGRISFTSTLWRTLSSAFSVATGAAIGREGSMIQFAAATTSWVGKRSGISDMPLSRQVACGVAAAVAAVYQAPVAGIFFAAEIVLADYAWVDLPLLALSSTAGWLVSGAVLGVGPLFVVHGTLALSHEVLWGLLLAVVMGLIAPLYHWLLESLRFSRRWPFALVWSGIAVGLLSLWRPEVWGNGDTALLETLGSHPTLSIVASTLVLRLAATTFCVGTGTVGGVFTPTVFAGGALGLIAGHLLHLPAPALLAIIGMGAFLAAVTHAPLMATFMVAELTGQWHLLPALLLCNALAWQISCRLSERSLYAIATPEPADERANSGDLLFRDAGP